MRTTVLPMVSPAAVAWLVYLALFGLLVWALADGLRVEGGIMLLLACMPRRGRALPPSPPPRRER